MRTALFLGVNVCGCLGDRQSTTISLTDAVFVFCRDHEKTEDNTESKRFVHYFPELLIKVLRDKSSQYSGFEKTILKVMPTFWTFYFASDRFG